MMPFGMSEEQRKELLAAHEQAHFHQISLLHDVNRLFDELDKEQLMALRILFRNFAEANDARIPSYYEGIAATSLKSRFNICTSCSVDHDAELLDQTPSVDDELARYTVKDPTEPVAQGPDWEWPKEDLAAPGPKLKGHEQPSLFENLPEVPVPKDEAAEKILYHEDNPLNLSDEDLENMQKYHLDDAWDEETMAFKGFICTGTGGKFAQPCGLIYVSIKDRMLKAPEDCHGCNSRGAWG